MVFLCVRTFSNPFHRTCSLSWVILFQIENPESLWNDTIFSLNGKVPFNMTSDNKRLLRQGIPISQRVRNKRMFTYKAG